MDFSTFIFSRQISPTHYIYLQTLNLWFGASNDWMVWLWRRIFISFFLVRKFRTSKINCPKIDTNDINDQSNTFKLFIIFNYNTKTNMKKNYLLQPSLNGFISEYQHFNNALREILVPDFLKGKTFFSSIFFIKR